MTQEKRTSFSWRRAAWAALGLSAALVVTLAVVAAGCGRKNYFNDPAQRPGQARSLYRVWSEAELEASLTSPAPQTPRWKEFVAAARKRQVLLDDFLYLEGHPEAVDATRSQDLPPLVTGPGYVTYAGAGRWHVVDQHFAPQSTCVRYLRLPQGQLIDNSDHEAWRFPVGAELVQLIYRRPPADQADKAMAQLVEWRRMRMAGPERGQMRTDGTRSDWVFESAVRDPANGLWTRGGDDGRDVTWTKIGPLGQRFSWPVIRPHTCAECHRLAGRSPLDGPRGGGEVYSLGDLREVVWAGRLDAVQPLLLYPVAAAEADRFAGQTRPPDPRQRYDLYLKLLSEQRGEPLAITRRQQTTSDGSPFYRNDRVARDLGREIYLTQCAACHGQAHGDGPLALRAPAPPPLERLSDSRILKTLRAGRGAMPAWNDILPGDDQWRLIEYLRTVR